MCRCWIQYGLYFILKILLGLLSTKQISLQHLCWQIEERRMLRDENRGLQAQLKDTAEAMRAAGELLFRLKEVE